MSGLESTALRTSWRWVLVYYNISEREQGKNVVCAVLSSHVFGRRVYTRRYVWSHQRGSHRGKVNSEASPPAHFLLHSTDVLWRLLFFSSRERLSCPFLSSIVESDFVYSPQGRSPLLGMVFRTHVPSLESFEVTNCDVLNAPPTIGEMCPAYALAQECYICRA